MPIRSETCGIMSVHIKQETNILEKRESVLKDKIHCTSEGNWNSVFKSKAEKCWRANFACISVYNLHLSLIRQSVLFHIMLNYSIFFLALFLKKYMFFYYTVGCYGESDQSQSRKSSCTCHRCHVSSPKVLKVFQYVSFHNIFSFIII